MLRFFVDSVLFGGGAAAAVPPVVTSSCTWLWHKFVTEYSYI